jgi:hypothetical protein
VHVDLHRILRGVYSPRRSTQVPPGQYRGKLAASVNVGASGADPPSSSSTGSNRMRLADLLVYDVLQLCHAGCSFPLEPLNSAGLRSFSSSESHKCSCSQVDSSLILLPPPPPLYRQHADVNAMLPVEAHAGVGGPRVRHVAAYHQLPFEGPSRGTRTPAVKSTVATEEMDSAGAYYLASIRAWAGFKGSHFSLTNRFFKPGWCFRY